MSSIQRHPNRRRNIFMGMTMTQKILASAAGLEEVHAGQLIMANLDMVLANDITGPVSINEMVKFEKKGVFDKDKVALIPDHFSPNKDIPRKSIPDKDKPPP